MPTAGSAPTQLHISLDTLDIMGTIRGGKRVIRESRMESRVIGKRGRARLLPSLAYYKRLGRSLALPREFGGQRLGGSLALPRELRGKGSAGASPSRDYGGRARGGEGSRELVTDRPCGISGVAISFRVVRTQRKLSIELLTRGQYFP